MDGHHRPVDVTDKAVAENDVRDFPVPAFPDIRQSAKTGDARGCASRLTAQRLVRELGQFRAVHANRRHRAPQVVTLLMTEPLQLAGARFRHAAHAFAGIDPGDGALPQPVIQAIGVAILDP